MAMVVNHNIPALQTYNTVNRTNDALTKSIQKLSTGLRINSAADDAAGLAISEKMRAQINGMDRATANAQDGISMIQTAEGALNETHSILQRMRELSVQAANDTLTSQDRGYIQLEIDELREEVTRIGNTTQFNKKKLLNGDAAVLWSSSDLSTKAVVNGGLRQIDQFGQKSSTEGNYNITIRANPGQGQVQKSDIFKIKHPNVVVEKQLNGNAGAKDIEVDNLPAASYSLDGVSTVSSKVTPTGSYNVVLGKMKTQEDTINYGGWKKPTGAVTDDSKVVLTIGSKKYESTTVLTRDSSPANFKTALTEALDALKGDYPSTGDVTLDYKDDGATAGTFTLSWVNKKGGDIPTVTLGYSGTYEAEADATYTAGSPSEADNTMDSLVTLAVADDTKLTGNASVSFEVLEKNTNNKTLTLRATAMILQTDGTTTMSSQEDILLKDGDTTPYKLDKLLGTGAATIQLAANAIGAFEKGSKFVYNVTKKDGANFGVAISSPRMDQSWDGKWDGGPIDGATMTYGLADGAANKDIHFKNYYLNTKTGEITEGDIILKANEKFTSANVQDGVTVASFDSTYIGKVAKGDVKLRDLDKFWDSQGVFMLNDPQTLTLTQGDGKQASVTFYATDTLNDVENKLNQAIAEGLGQGKYVNRSDKFVTFVNAEGGKNSESVAGTFLIRTVVPGEAGSISFSGNEDIINAFSLNTIQDAKESTYTVNIKDAHTNAVVASNVQVTGNKLVGVINPNVDVEFDALAGVSATWDTNRNAFNYTTADKTTTLHLTDNTTVFQVGANEGEDMGVNIGDMRSTALGIDRVNVTNREAAARSITIIDNAIDKVSTQRAKLGAYQNRLEHTINNLNTASENITAAESRIRDTDMAKEMMNFTKLQIMLQAGNSMLAQANQLPQNVLSLIR